MMFPGDAATGLDYLLMRHSKEDILNSSEVDTIKSAIALLRLGIVQTDTGEREAWDAYAAAAVSKTSLESGNLAAIIADQLLEERRRRFGGGR